MSALQWQLIVNHYNYIILNLQRVRLKVEIHEIQFSEVTNYRNPQNPPPISQNPHAEKRNPTPATKSTQHPQKVIIEIHQRWTVNHVF